MLCTSATRSRTRRRSNPNRIWVSWPELVSFANTFSKLHKERACTSNFHFMETMLLKHLSVWLWPNQHAGTGLSSMGVHLSIGQRRGNDSSDGVCILPVFSFLHPPPPRCDICELRWAFPLCQLHKYCQRFQSPSLGFTVRFKYVSVAFGFQGMSQWRKAEEKTVLPSVSRHVIPFFPLRCVLLHLVSLTPC